MPGNCDFLSNTHTKSCDQALVVQEYASLCCNLFRFWFPLMLQAALALADWCLCNCRFLQNRCVLELGSGVGLTGLCVSLYCKPSSYWFSDCHPAVLRLLQSNILLNVTGQNDHVPGEGHEENAFVEHTHSDDKNVTTSACEGDEDNELCDRCHVLLQTSCNNAEIGVLNLPWETVPTSSFVTQLSPEVVLAAGLSSALFGRLHPFGC